MYETSKKRKNYAQLFACKLKCMTIWTNWKRLGLYLSFFFAILDFHEQINDSAIDLQF